MSNALELAAELEFHSWYGAPDKEQANKRKVALKCKAAAELRRLDAENAQLRAELEAIYSAVPVAWMQEDQEEPDIGKWFADSTSPFDWITNTPLIPLPERKS